MVVFNLIDEHLVELFQNILDINRAYVAIVVVVVKSEGHLHGRGSFSALNIKI